jgi:hypothetical protein
MSAALGIGSMVAGIAGVFGAFFINWGLGLVFLALSVLLIYKAS